MKAWSPVIVILITTIISYCDAAMSMQVFKQSMTMMMKVCQGKSGISQETLNQLSDGGFPETEDRKLKRYFECFFRMGNGMKGRSVNVDALRRSARTMVPVELRPLMLSAAEACKHETDKGDACESAFAYAKCNYVETIGKIFAVRKR